MKNSKENLDMAGKKIFIVIGCHDDGFTYFHEENKKAFYEKISAELYLLELVDKAKKFKVARLFIQDSIAKWTAKNRYYDKLTKWQLLYNEERKRILNRVEYLSQEELQKIDDGDYYDDSVYYRIVELEIE